ncbi:hypothetical protein [Emcibacter sp. SYSU 3D8]|uniref:hypothetical protein n=1 Tax=Emcibacter sp. SYSU 3D8 TaxID=3133969 RepID=UPI0031FF1560
MTLLILLGTVVVTSILSPLFLMMLMRASRRPPDVDKEGRTVLGLTPGLVVLGICSAATCLALVALFIVLAFNSQPWDLATAFVPAIGSLMFVLLGCAVYGLFCVSARYGTDGILYRRFASRRLVPWNQIDQVVDHPIFGTYLRTAAGRLYVSKYRTGFQQLLGELRSHGVKGAERRSLARLV